MIDFVRYNLGRKNNAIVEYPSSFNLKKWTSTSIDAINATKFGTTKN